jgi:diguanylate cyclase (GGDEF)-like protein/PAS domain S-box-containing protein
MKIKLNLREKLLIVVIIGLLFTFSGVATLQIYDVKQSFNEQIERSGQDRSTLIAESVANLIIAYDYSNIESLTKRIALMSDVQQISIFNRSGKLMASQTSPILKPDAKGLTFVTPVNFSGAEVGRVELKLSLDRLDALVHKTYLNLLFFIIVFTLVFGILIYTTVSIYIVKPICHISKAAQQLALGDFSTVLPPVSSDELGHLVQSFSSMRETRQRVENELNTLNANLEHLVMERVGELHSSEAYIRAVLENVNEGIIVIDEANMIVTFNPAAEKIFGFSVQMMIKQSFNILIAAESLDQSGKYSKYTDEVSIFGVTREVIGMRKDLSAFPLELKTSLITIQNKPLYIISARDISDRKNAEQRISYMASHDALTNLPNRTLLQDRIQQTLAHCVRRHQQAAIIFIDLDKFKAINDTLGHDVGDALLKETSARLVSHVRSDDTVARHGGDEFIILLTEICHPEDAGAIAQKLLESLLLPFNIKNHTLYISASIGIAIYPDDGQNMETLLKNSDLAMYHAKETGRNNYQFFSAKLNELAAEKMSLLSELRHAIERNELFLTYQPVVDLPTNKLCGLEVLLRWRHPQLGLISPVNFIPLAEESGLILPIGEWVFRTVCAQVSVWLAQGYEVPRLAINLSAKQFLLPTLGDTFASILKESALNPHYIGFEITESMLVHNVEETTDTLMQFNRMGIEISIDDFGTGYSSLSYLKKFPINKLKIDKSFVDDVTQNPDDAAIVKAIIAMAHGLSILVVSEGVETQGQLDFLALQGCDQYQGYLYSKPLTALEIVTRLNRMGRADHK